MIEEILYVFWLGMDSCPGQIQSCCLSVLAMRCLLVSHQRFLQSEHCLLCVVFQVLVVSMFQSSYKGNFFADG